MSTCESLGNSDLDLMGAETCIALGRCWRQQPETFKLSLLIQPTSAHALERGQEKLELQHDIKRGYFKPPANNLKKIV